MSRQLLIEPNDKATSRSTKPEKPPHRRLRKKGKKQSESQSPMASLDGFAATPPTPKAKKPSIKGELSNAWGRVRGKNDARSTGTQPQNVKTGHNAEQKPKTSAPIHDAQNQLRIQASEPPSTPLQQKSVDRIEPSPHAQPYVPHTREPVTAQTRPNFFLRVPLPAEDERGRVPTVSTPQRSQIDPTTFFHDTPQSMESTTGQAGECSADTNVPLSNTPIGTVSGHKISYVQSKN